jgi:serine phosphatase RsbU (regulator of sigma subunit)
MATQENLIGAILIDFSNTIMGKDSPQKLWDDKYQLLQTIADQTANSIDNLQRLRSREEEAYISVALLQVAQAIVSMNKLSEILGAIVRITPILVGVKRSIIYLWNSHDLVFHPAENYGFSKNDLQVVGQIFRLNEFPMLETIMIKNQIAYHQLLAASSPTIWKEIASSEIHLIQGTNDDTDEQYSIKLDEDVLRDKSRFLIGFPLSVKNEVLGVMLIEEEDPVKGTYSYHIREKRIEIVKGITQQATLAIKNDQLQQEVVRSERMEKELQLAREIQTTFLPEHLPTLPGWDMDIRWQPARQVGGDFYDVLYLDENHIGLVIADVADKGMPAALFMTLIRTLIRAAAKDHISPSIVLKQVNELLIPDSKHGMFVTIFYAVINLQTGLIIYTNAGHNPPIIKKYPSSEIVELTRTSIALGLFDDIQVDEAKVGIQPGDLLLLYTDGVTEAFSMDEKMFGTKRLYDLVTKKQYSSSKELLDDIECSINEFINGVELSDDITMAALYRKTS